MSASYPTSVKSFTTKTAGQTIASAHTNDLQDETVAVEGGLLNGFTHDLKPSVAGAENLGTASLPWGDAHIRGLDFDAAAELTTASGAVTVTQSYHTIDTQDDDAADDLDTLTASGVTEGFVVVLRAENTARVVTVKDGTGNLLLNGDCELDATDSTITLIYDGTNWRELARSVTATGSRLLDADLAVAAATNTVSETTLYTFNIPADTIGTTRALRLTLIGEAVNASGGTAAWTPKITFGGTTVATGASANLNDASNDLPWKIECLIAPNGAADAQRGHTVWRYQATDAASGAFTASGMQQAHAINNALAVDTTAQVTIAFTVVNGTATNFNVKLFAAMLELLQP